MTDRSRRDGEYVIVRDAKPKKSTHHYYDGDDDDDNDNDSQIGSMTRRIIRTKPSKEQRIKYVTTDEFESDYRRARVPEPRERGVKIRYTTNNEQVVLDEDDEDDNVIKIIRNPRTQSPPYVDNRRVRNRPHESRTLYYETSDGHLVARSSMNPSSTRTKNDFVYAEDEPTKVIRKVIIDPRTGDRQTIYEKGQPKKQAQQKYIIRKQPTEIPVDSDDEYEQPQQQQPQYVQVVQRRTEPKQAPPPPPPTTRKYMMIRKKADSEVGSAISSSVPTVKNNRRIVYESSPKKSSNTYVYSSNGKYYK